MGQLIWNIKQGQCLGHATHTTLPFPGAHKPAASWFPDLDWVMGEGPSSPLPVPLWACLSLLPPADSASSPGEGVLCPAVSYLLWNSAEPTKEIEIHDFLIQVEEERTRSLSFSSSTKVYRSPFAIASLNIPSKCWKLTWNHFTRFMFLCQKIKNLRVKTQKKDASLCLYYLPWGSCPAFLLSTPFISRCVSGSQNSSIFHRVMYF